MSLVLNNRAQMSALALALASHLNAIWLRFFLCDGQGAVRSAVLYEDRSIYYHMSFNMKKGFLMYM